MNIAKLVTVNGRRTIEQYNTLDVSTVPVEEFRELSKLEKQQVKIEKKIKKNADAQAKFDASKTIVSENDLNVDAKVLEKEQKQAQKLLDEKAELEAELKKITDKIDLVRSDLSKKNTAISDLEKEKPLSNSITTRKK